MWRAEEMAAENKPEVPLPSGYAMPLPALLLQSVSQSVFCGTSTYCVLNTVPPIEDDHGNSNSSHVKIFLPKKLLECLPKCSSLPKERHRWNTNEEWKICTVCLAHEIPVMAYGTKCCHVIVMSPFSFQSGLDGCVLVENNVK
ncbi:hypothetical protein STEG23_014845 [Scotinomys teguina]